MGIVLLFGGLFSIKFSWLKNLSDDVGDWGDIVFVFSE